MTGTHTGTSESEIERGEKKKTQTENQWRKQILHNHMKPSQETILYKNKRRRRPAKPPQPSQVNMPVTCLMHNVITQTLHRYQHPGTQTTIPRAHYVSSKSVTHTCTQYVTDSLLCTQGTALILLGYIHNM